MKVKLGRLVDSQANSRSFGFSATLYQEHRKNGFSSCYVTSTYTIPLFQARISKLVDIWDRGSTFPSTMLSGFRQKLTAPPQNGKLNTLCLERFCEKEKGDLQRKDCADSDSRSPVAPRSTTPTGSPPKDFIPLNGAATTAGAAPAPDTSKILQALADMAKSNTTAIGGLPAPTSSGNFNSLQNAFTQNIPSSVNAASSMPSMGQSVSMPGGADNPANAFGGMSSLSNFPQPGMPNGQQGNMQQANPLAPTGPSPEVLQQQVQIIQLLQAQGVPQDQWATVLSVMMSTGALGGGASNAPQQPYGQNQNQNQNQGYGTNDLSRDRSGYNDQYNQRSPSGRYRNRSRSPSPGPGYRRDPSPPRRRDSPTYGAYGRNGRDGRGGGISSGGRDYRQRSPNRPRKSASPRRDSQALPPPGPRNIEYDRTLPPGHIKGIKTTYIPMLPETLYEYPQGRRLIHSLQFLAEPCLSVVSRKLKVLNDIALSMLLIDLFSSSEDHLRGIFAQFGLVQTCIVNVDKRHAFVKMLTRQDSVRAKEGMERYKSPDMQLRVRPFAPNRSQPSVFYCTQR